MSVISLLLAHTSTVSLALVLTGFIFLYFYWKSSKSSNYSFPPGPPALPVIGNLNILDLHRPYKTLSKLSETYGNVFTFHMGPKKYVVLTGYEAVKEALVTQADDFSERGQTHTTNTSSRGGN
ncbi:cytochrome P450 2K3-like, partial [Polyodon spathula]|uniref:cytochrome P450 2K3-like n=1 Tax=Polyodon spathula TaxID=7913 RepID=UPI001B7DAF38